MSRNEKKKIPTNAAENVGGGFFDAFAGLSAEGLPSGPAEPAGQAVPSSETPAKTKGKPGRVVLRKETAHRGGKAVIVIDGFSDTHTEEEIAELGRKLRASCGCGGAQKGRILEMQGDLAGRIREFLQQIGYTVAGVK